MSDETAGQIPNMSLLRAKAERSQSDQGRVVAVNTEDGAATVSGVTQRTWEFILEANPTVVLGLLDELDRLRGESEAATEAAKNFAAALVLAEEECERLHVLIDRLHDGESGPCPGCHARIRTLIDGQGVPL